MADHWSACEKKSKEARSIQQGNWMIYSDPKRLKKGLNTQPQNYEQIFQCLVMSLPFGTPGTFSPGEENYVVFFVNKCLSPPSPILRLTSTKKTVD